MKLKLVDYNCGVSLWKENGTFVETTVEHNMLIPENIATKEIFEIFKKCLKRIDKNDNK